jgi:hypothetical protein
MLIRHFRKRTRAWLKVWTFTYRPLPARPLLTEVPSEKCRMSNVECRMSNVECRITRLWRSRGLGTMNHSKPSNRSGDERAPGELRARLAHRTLPLPSLRPSPFYMFSAPTKNWLGARDLSRRNAGTADPRWAISRPLRQPTFLRAKVRAPFARAAITLNRYSPFERGGILRCLLANPTAVSARRTPGRIERLAGCPLSTNLNL